MRQRSSCRAEHANSAPNLHINQTRRAALRQTTSNSSPLQLNHGINSNLLGMPSQQPAQELHRGKHSSCTRRSVPQTTPSKASTPHERAGKRYKERHKHQDHQENSNPVTQFTHLLQLLGRINTQANLRSRANQHNLGDSTIKIVLQDIRSCKHTQI